MPEYDNTNSFVLFPVKDKKSDKHPNLSGTLTDENGVEYYIDGWTNTTHDGRKYINGKIKRKEPKPETVDRTRGGQDRNAPRPPQTSYEPLTDEDIPF